MTTTIKNFSIFKNQNKKKDTQPDYRLSTKIGDEYVDIGAGWKKTSKDGTSSFISVKLSDAYETRAGFHLEIEVPPMKVVDDRPVEKKMAYPKETIDPDKIEF